MRPTDDVSKMSDVELRTMLLTLDGRGVANKTAALDELLSRAAHAKTEPQELLAGKVWRSETLAQVFMVTSGDPLGLPRSVHFPPQYSEDFIGHPAVRLPDNSRALVALTKKPDDYPYDFVLI